MRLWFSKNHILSNFKQTHTLHYGTAFMVVLMLCLCCLIIILLLYFEENNPLAEATLIASWVTPISVHKWV